MNRDWRRPQQLINLGAVLSVAAVLALLGGVPGLLFGVAAFIAWLVGPPIFAFIFGQAGLAAVTTSPYTPLVGITEIALVGIVISDPEIPLRPRTQGVALTGGLTLAGIIWLLRTDAIWTGALISLGGFGVLLYAVHRYELLITDQLTPSHE